MGIFGRSVSRWTFFESLNALRISSCALARLALATPRRSGCWVCPGAATEWADPGSWPQRNKSLLQRLLVLLVLLLLLVLLVVVVDLHTLSLCTLGQILPNLVDHSLIVFVAETIGKSEGIAHVSKAHAIVNL